MRDRLLDWLGRLKPLWTTNSLAFRLLAASTLWTLVVLPITAWLLNSLYREQVELSFDNRLELSQRALIASLETSSGTLVPPTDFGDELFNLPLTGWYWQVLPADLQPGQRLVSPSLLDQSLTFPETRASKPAGKPFRVAEATGPDGGAIRMLAREFTISDDPAKRRYLAIVTGKLSEIEESVKNFRNRLVATLSVLGLGLIAATLFQVHYGLRPLSAIKTGLSDIRSGRATRLEGNLPAEIVPLQGELNALIQSNQDIIERARTHVGNLAHALKTPLSVIANEAGAEQTPLARKVIEQTQIMRDQVQHHLDRARMVARVGVIGGVTEVKPVADALIRALGRIHGERGLDMTSDCAPGMNFQGERQDLEEMLGNILDNACKWAKGRVSLTVRIESSRGRPGTRRLVLLVEDDGPGLNAAERAAARTRGKRLDETKPGSGLGLSIVTELAGLYGGTFDLDRSSLGGLLARLDLPAA